MNGPCEFLNLLLGHGPKSEFQHLVLCLQTNRVSELVVTCDRCPAVVVLPHLLFFFGEKLTKALSVENDHAGEIPSEAHF